MGTPTPYLQIDHSGNGGSQTLFGRIDKDETYAADLKLTFVHKPTLSTYSSTFEIVASDKPKFGYPSENWQEIMRSGVCEHCKLPGHNMNGRANWQYDETNSRWNQTINEWNNAEPSLYSLDILGATLNYADMSGSGYDYINFRNSHRDGMGKIYLGNLLGMGCSLNFSVITLSHLCCIYLWKIINQHL